MTLTKRVGQRVLIAGGRFHGAATITKINPKNVLVTMEGTGQRVNAHPSFLSDLPEGEAAPTRFDVTVSADVPVQHPGSLVRVKNKPGVFVVLADKFDKINVAEIGGDGGRYWRIPRAGITPLEAADVTAIKISIGG